MPQSALSPTPAANKRSRLRHPLLLITGIMLVAANLRAALTSVGPLLEQIQQQLSLSATSAGLLNSLPLILFAVLSPVTPSLAKRMGIERTLGMALLLLIGGIVLRSLPQTSMLWLGTVLIGAAIAFANVVLPTLVKTRLPKPCRRHDCRLCGGDVTGGRHGLRSGSATGGVEQSWLAFFPAVLEPASPVGADGLAAATAPSRGFGNG